MRFRRTPKSDPDPEPTAPTDLDADRLTITWKLPLADAPAWLRRRGYRAAISLGTVSAGIVFSRGDEPARLAVVGETLVFDGDRVTVEESE